MFSLIKPPKLPPHLLWKFAHEPQLLGWSIRARNYNTFLANGLFVVLSLIFIGFAYALHPRNAPAEDYFFNTLCSAGFYIFTCSMAASMTHQRMNFAYRFSRSGVEYCEWKDFPRWALPLLRWVAGITSIIFIFLATLDPAFLLGALAGPCGIGLLYLKMAYSKGFRDLHTRYHHHEFEWQEITQLAIATNREIVDLKYNMVLRGQHPASEWNFNIHCQRKQKEQIANFIKPYLLPGVPFIRAKLDFLMSTG